jgi:hypothetical protein
MKEMGDSYQHIYITSDEEIKVADWVLAASSSTVTKCEMTPLGLPWKKIILTTDPDLIADGVQAIDDDFLEWFVQNPSCEYVEVTRNFADEGIKGITYYGKYFIIIPQEEPKQYPIGGYAPGSYTCTCVTCKKQFIGDKRAVQCEPCATEMVNTKIVENNGGYQIGEPNEETLEEASWRYNPVKKLDAEFIRQAFKEGASWQAKQDKNKYSKEEMLEFAEYCLNNVDAFTNPESLLKQFKKKNYE